MRKLDDPIAESLKLWRKKVGLTQDEVARRLKVSRERYANWERGIVSPPMNYRIMLTELGVQALPGVQEVREMLLPYNSQKDEIIVLLDTLQNSTATDAQRERARRVLDRLLGLDATLENAK